jgi:putative ABC transport system permease protein
MESVIHELSLALRRLLGSPGFSLVALLTLMLGIGATTTVFSVVDKTLFVSLPSVDRPQTVAWFFEENGAVDTERDTVSTGNYLDWKKQTSTFSSVSALTLRGFNATLGDEPERVEAILASADFFATLGTPPALGRVFSAQDDRPGAERVAVLSHGYWSRRMASRPEVLGSRLVLDGTAYTIVGVLPPRFRFFKDADLYVPLFLDGNAPSERNERKVGVIGRLKSTVTLEEAQAEMRAVSARLAELYPETHRGWSVSLVPLQELLVGPGRLAGVALLIAVGLVLSVACANISSLLLVRGAARQREMAIRVALGATRERLLAELLTESLVLATVGAALGVLLSLWGVDLIVGLVPAEVKWDLPGLNDVTVDGRCLAFTAAVASLAAIMFGLVPALRASRPDLMRVFQDAGLACTPSPRTRRLNRALVMAQVVAALVLVSSAAWTVETLIRSQRVELGFRPEGLLTARVHLAETKYPDRGARVRFHDELLQRLSTLPGLRQVAVASRPPLERHYDEVTFTLDGKPKVQAAEKPTAKQFLVSPGYFSVLGIPLRSGRAFDQRDRLDGPPVAIISQRLKERHFANENPIGKRLHLANDRSRQIVGVAGDVHDGFRREQAFVYVPWAQAPAEQLTILIHTDQDPGALMAPLRDQVRRLDAQQPVTHSRTGGELVDGALFLKRMMMKMFAVLAVLALLLAGVGIYGVVAFSVAERREELKIRSALGARPGELLLLVQRDAMVVVMGGVMVGLPLSVVAAQGIARALDGPPGLHLGTWTVSAVLLLLVAVLASWCPARLALRGR